MRMRTATSVMLDRESKRAKMAAETERKLVPESELEGRDNCCHQAATERIINLLRRWPRGGLLVPLMPRLLGEPAAAAAAGADGPSTD